QASKCSRRARQGWELGVPWELEGWKLEVDARVSKPSRNRNFLVGVEIERVAAVDLEVAEEAVARAAEGEVGHRRRDADVDADHRRGGPMAEFSGRLAAGREDRGGVRVGVPLHHADCL